MNDKDTKLISEAYEKINEFNEDNILQSSENQKHYKTSANKYTDQEFLKIVWNMPTEKIEQLIELLTIDRKTAIELSRAGGRIMGSFHRKDKLFFDSYLKWAKQILNHKLKGLEIPQQYKENNER